MITRNKKEHLLNGVPMIMASANDELLLETISLLDRIYTVKIVATTKKICEINSLKEMYQAKIVLLDSNLLNSNPKETLSSVSRSGLKIIMVADATPKAFQRSLQYMTYGAVDLLLKNQIRQGLQHDRYRNQLINRFIGAAKLESPKMVAVKHPRKKTSHESIPTVLFCEDCGAKNIFPATGSEEHFYCRQCGDLLENHLISRYKRTSHVTVLVAGLGSYRNLINIIPQISSNFGGTLIVVVSGPVGHVDSLSKYLHSISQLPVKRVSNGCEIEGGCCYIAASDENFVMKPFSTSSRMERAKPSPPNGAFDIMMKSVSESFKHKSAALFLSGDTEEGENGVNFMKKNGGKSAILSFTDCINSQIGEHILRSCQIDKIVAEEDASVFLENLLKPQTSSPMPVIM